MEAMGKTILHVGPLGAGQAIKVISNSVAVTNAVTVAEGLIAGTAAGVDLDALVAVMDGGAAGSRMLALKQQPMRSHDFTPLFRLAHMIKDVELCSRRHDGARSRASSERSPTCARPSGLVTPTTISRQSSSPSSSAPGPARPSRRGGSASVRRRSAQ